MNKYAVYERIKAEIARTAKSAEEYEKKFNFRFEGNRTKHYDKAEGRFSFTNKYRANEWLLDNEIYEFMSDDEWVRLINNLYAVYKA